MTLQAFLSKLENVRSSGDGYSTRCPAHDDHHNSLSVHERDGRILLKCHAHNCSAEAICKSLGLTTRELFTDAAYGRKEISKHTWEIRDIDGKLIAEHVRHNYDDGSKSFTWHRPDGTLGLNGMRVDSLPLYGVRMLQGYRGHPEEAIYICEGEKSTEALWGKDCFAVGTVTGAGSCPSLESLKPLVSCPNKVILWPDNDLAGRSHMNQAGQRLCELGKIPYILTWPDAPPKGDAGDFKGNLDAIHALPSRILVRSYISIPFETKTTTNERDKNGTTNGTASFKNKVENGTKTSTNERDKNGTRNGTDDLSRLLALAARVEAWVKETNGWFATEELDRDLGIIGKARDNRRKIMLRLTEQGIVEAHPRINKRWRYINIRVTALDFKTATTEGVLPLKWPLNIEKYVNLYPGNIALVAGAPNAGKTALLLNLIHKNQDAFPVFYFCSEMGGIELRSRLDLFPGMAIEAWKFQAIERASDFADVIRPDCVNVIDYLELTEELYQVNTHLTAINRKLGTGIAIVALQKKENAKYGRGQEFGLEKPKLYLSLDKGKLTIIKGKSWANKNVDPAGLQISFKIVSGCQFEATGQWERKG